MTTVIRSKQSNLQNKTTAAKLAKSVEKALLADCAVEIFPGFWLTLEDTATLVRMAHDDVDEAGGSLRDKMAHCVRDALIDRLIDYRNGDCGKGKLWRAFHGQYPI